MFQFVIVLLTIRNSFSADFPKCCDSDSFLQKTDTGYNCSVDHNKRIQIYTNRTNFIQSQQPGSCVDTADSAVYLYNVSGDEICPEKLDNFISFPKCCPLNYFYNTTSHGCFRSGRRQQSFFVERFVRVGLPKCKIIVDWVVTHYLRSNGSLHFADKIYRDGSYCIDKNQDDSYSVRICYEDYDVCESIKCVRKCCPDGQSFINGSFCRNTYKYGLDFSSLADSMDNINESFAIIHDGYRAPIYPLMASRFRFHLDSKGIFTMVEYDQTLGNMNITKHYNYDEKEYCVEHAQKSTLNDYLFFRSFSQQTEIKYWYAGIAMAISCVFLILTILYYVLTNEKKSLFGKILISYCCASLITWVPLSYYGLSTVRPPKGSDLCVILAFCLFYFTLAMITWTNVMCIDIYCTFGSSKSFSSRQHKSKELKRFMLYSLHGWGTPLVLTTIPLIFYHVRVLPDPLQIIITDEKCFFYKGDGNYAQFLFSTVPFATSQICNLILFIKTAMYCWSVKKEISRMNDTQQTKGEKKQKFNKFRDRFGLLLKLFFIMGISFLFEVVSTFYDFKRNHTMAMIELVWDTFNSLQGVFIFAIFILKKRNFQTCKQTVGLKKLRKISLVSSGMTQTTSLATFSK